MAKLGDYKLQGLKDSRLFYLRNPPKFMFISIGVVIMVLLSSLVWACCTTKAEEVENSGIVVDAGVGVISTEVAGKIISVRVSEGDIVDAGDTLLILDSSTVESERAGYQASLNHYTTRIALINEFIDSLNLGKPNPFVDYGDEKEFFETRQSYDNELSSTSATSQAENIRQKYLSNLYQQSTQYNKDVLNGEMYSAVIDEDNDRISKTDRLIEAAKDNTSNPFNSTTETEFYNVFAQYKLTYEKYIEFSQREPEASWKGYEAQAFSFRESFIVNQYTGRANLEKEIAQYQVYVDNGEKSAKRLTFVDQMIDTLVRNSTSNPFNPLSADAVEVEYSNLFLAYLSEIKQLNLDDKMEAIKLKYLQSMNSDKNNANAQVLQLQTQITACDSNIAKYTISASVPGTVHLDMNLRKGAPLQADTQIGSINTGADKQVELFVSAHDRARLDVGQDCKFTVDGLLQTEYGCARGKVLSIANDATVSEKGSFFRIIVAFDNAVLTDKDGNQIEIINGMTVKMWIVYEKNTYMDYFLDKLGLK